TDLSLAFPGLEVLGYCRSCLRHCSARVPQASDVRTDTVTTPPADGNLPPVTAPQPASGAVRQFPCKQCGANLTFTPGTTHLTCPYCGHAEEVPVGAGEIQEHDLEAALAQAPKARGWGTETRSIRCENCGATTTFTAEQVAGACAF